MEMNQQNKEIKRKNEDNNGDKIFITTFYIPLVENETESNGFHSFRDNATFLNYLSEYLGGNLYNFSDDSIKDPDNIIVSDEFTGEMEKNRTSKKASILKYPQIKMQI